MKKKNKKEKTEQFKIQSMAKYFIEIMLLMKNFSSKCRKKGIKITERLC